MKKLLVAIMLGGMMLLAPTPAMAWGHMHPCAYHASHTNAWGAYLYHRVNVYEKVCEGSSLSVIGPHPHYIHWLKGATRPNVSFSARNGVPQLDSVHVTKRPHLVQVYHSSGRVVKLRYDFVVKKCNLGTTGYKLCSERTFRVYVDKSFTRLCSVVSSFGGGSHLKCDDRKWF